MISIVVSLFNEEDIICDFHEILIKILDENNIDSEIIYVNDGSKDKSLDLLCELKRTSTINLKIINLSRNFGHEAAMIAGIDHAEGEAIICMDSDLQHPPLLIPKMVQKFKDGFHIVKMVREKREDNGWLKNKFSQNFYLLINKLSDQKLQENVSDFFLISGKAANLLRVDYRERNRFLRGFIQIIGFRDTALNYTSNKRPAGKTKYSFVRLVKLSINAIISFSKFPLFLGIYLGLIFAVFSLLLAIYSICVYFFGSTPPSGYTTLILFMSIGFTIMFFLIGIIGIYVGYNFDESKKRPIYIVDEII